MTVGAATVCLPKPLPQSAITLQVNRHQKQMGSVDKAFKHGDPSWLAVLAFYSIIGVLPWPILIFGGSAYGRINNMIL